MDEEYFDRTPFLAKKSVASSQYAMLAKSQLSEEHHDFRRFEGKSDRSSLESNRDKCCCLCKEELEGTSFKRDYLGLES